MATRLSTAPLRYRQKNTSVFSSASTISGNSSSFPLPCSSESYSAVPPASVTTVRVVRRSPSECTALSAFAAVSSSDCKSVADISVAFSFIESRCEEKIIRRILTDA